MLDYFNGVITPKNNELRQLLGFKPKTKVKRIPFTYVADKGSFARIIVTPEDGKPGFMMVYVKQVTFEEYLKWRPF